MSIKILDCDFSVRLLNYAKCVGATTIKELEESLKDDKDVYIPGSLIASRRVQFFNKKRIRHELQMYQECVLDKDPSDTYCYEG